MALSDVLQKLQKASGNDPVSTGPMSNFEEELKKVNQEIYERNVELSIRNRTFAILQKIYQIIDTSLGVEETAYKVIEAIVDELKFQKGFIALVDADHQYIRTIAHSMLGPDLQTILDQYGQPFKNLKVPMSLTDNYCVRTINQKIMHMTNDVYDVLMPMVDRKGADDIMAKLNIQTSILFPLEFAGSALGVIVFAMDKHIGLLSRAEYEILKELIEVVSIAIERSQIYADLKKANEQLKEVDKLKDEFVSVASHELRTPMTAIKSYLWMALSGKGGELTPKMKYYLDRSYNSTDRLIKLVNDMLNISRIESGRMTFEWQKVDIKQLVDDVIAEVKPRADELGLSIVVEPMPSTPIAFADPDKLKEVFINLIGNSLKFTPRGGVITVKVQEQGGKIVTSVTDTGVGIPQEDMGLLFQKFSLLKGSYVTNQNASLGTGLGLYICKSIVSAHNGEISVSSPGRDKGATFTFTLNSFLPGDEARITTVASDAEKIGIIHSTV